MKDKKEIVSYLFFGMITTLINLVSYAMLTQFLNADFKTATTIAAFLSVLFAFITNKLYVFESRDKNFIIVSKELSSFLLSRVMSYGLDLVSMIVLVEILLFDDMVSKVIANILVVIFNYLASKFFVFRQLAGSDHEH